jgi:AraC-like DNA-binding protein
MNEYAKQLFYSPEEYGMLFSDEFIIFKKLRPIDTLIEMRLERASDLITTTDLNIYEIASECGYNTVSFLVVNDSIINIRISYSF